MDQIHYIHHHKPGSNTVVLVLHGGGAEGIETPFISSIIDATRSVGLSVFGFNFPYCERGDEQSSGENLLEEIRALDDVISHLHSIGYNKIVIVAKSLGAIISSYWLKEKQDLAIELVILGYVVGSVKTASLTKSLKLVIQGEQDRFGDPSVVKEEFESFGITASIVSINNADHSYRDTNKSPIYQDKVVTVLTEYLLGNY